MEAGTLYPLSKGESLLVGVPNGSHELRGIFIFAKGKGYHSAVLKFDVTLIDVISTLHS